MARRHAPSTGVGNSVVRDSNAVKWLVRAGTNQLTKAALKHPSTSPTSTSLLSFSSPAHYDPSSTHYDPCSSTLTASPQKQPSSHSPLRLIPSNFPGREMSPTRSHYQNTQEEEQRRAKTVGEMVVIVERQHQKRYAQSPSGVTTNRRRLQDSRQKSRLTSKQSPPRKTIVQYPLAK